MRGPGKYIILLFVGSIAFAALFFYLGYRSFYAAGPAGQDAVYILPQGQGVIRTAWELEQKGVITSRNIFKLGVKLSGVEHHLKAGEYDIPAYASMSDIVAILSTGKVIQHPLTIIEGWTSWQIAAYLNGLDTLVDPLTELPREGSVLPDTYLYARQTSRHDLIRRMQMRQLDFLDEVWDKRASGLPFVSAGQAVVLASIVEKETAKAQERAHIAGVFINRLIKNMRLQSDPTVIYGLDRRGSLNRSLRKSDLKSDNPYNTYRIRGLPPTAINHPGRAAIVAVLHPLETDDLYFVADGTGGHAFARTLRQHKNNVRRWRQIKKQKKLENAD